MSVQAGPSLTEFLAKVQDLYTLPPLLVRFNKLFSDPNITAQDVADAIGTDLALTAKVLRVVNSSYYGFSRKVGNLKTAIVIMGFREIRKLVFTLGTIRFFGTTKGLFPLYAFWHHCVATGALCEVILTHRQPDLKDDGFVAGLLHDLGKLLIAQQDPHSFSKVRQLIEEGRSWRESERLLLGFDHAQVGGALAGAWHFPPALTSAICWHHDLNNAPGEKVLVAAVRLADTCARAALVDVPGAAPLEAVEDEVWQILGCETGFVAQLFEALPSCLQFVEGMLQELPRQRS